MLRRLLKHASHYTVGNLLMMVAGLVSFPILTRLFSVADYGTMSLVSTLLLVGVAVGKLGIQHAAVRFHAEAVTGKGGLNETIYASTTLLGMSACAVMATLLWLAWAQWGPAQWLGGEAVRELLLLTAVLVLVRTLDSGLLNILRARQQSLAHTVYSVVKKYALVAGVLAVVIYLLPGLHGFFWATIAVELLCTLGLAVYLLRQVTVSWSAFSPALLMAMLAYGLPMLAQELAALLLLQGDRYVIQARLGSEALGIYSAGYNLAEYVKSVLVMSFGTAVIPMYTRLWEEKGVAATSEFISKALHFYVIAASALAFGLVAVAGELVTLLASAKYALAAGVIPFVIVAMMVEGANQLLGAGIYIRKQSWIIMLMVLVAALGNVGLNLLLVPRLGIQGSALSSLLVMTLLSLGMFWFGRRHLPVSLPALHLLKMLAAGALACLAAKAVTLPWLLATIGLRMLIGAVVFAALVCLLDAPTRALCAPWWRRLRGPRAP
jgi:O-antigen/teichoic acid export membrane protein